MDIQIVGAIIGPLLTALLAGIAVVVRQWQTARVRQDEREASLERRREQIGFIDTWLTAHQRVSGMDPQAQQHTQRALSDLEFLYQQVSVELRHPPPPARRHTAVDAVKVLLLIPSHGGAAKTLRALYYILALCGIGWTIATISTLGDSTDGVVLNIVVAMILTIVGFAPAALVAVIARAADRSRRTRDTDILQPVAPQPLEPSMPPGQVQPGWPANWGS